MNGAAVAEARRGSAAGRASLAIACFRPCLRSAGSDHVAAAGKNGCGLPVAA
jgi:hypothetical protein